MSKDIMKVHHQLQSNGRSITALSTEREKARVSFIKTIVLFCRQDYNSRKRKVSFVVKHLYEKTERLKKFKSRVIKLYIINKYFLCEKMDKAQTDPQADSGGMEVEKAGESEEIASSGITQKSSTNTQKKRTCKATQGRPPSKKVKPQIQYAQRTESIPVYAKWSENKRVLIAIELQYCYSLTPYEGNPKNISESGFLNWEGKKQTNSVCKQDKDFEPYATIRELRQVPQTPDSKDPDLRDIRDMVQLALTVKHEMIWKEWALVYDKICERVTELRGLGQDFIVQQNRRKWQDKISEQLLQIIKNRSQFIELKKLIKEGQIDFRSLLKKQAYCFLAEFFNFRINEYFADAFEPPIIQGTSKKQKTK